MLDPKLSIPRAILGSLVLGGVAAGCGGGGTDAGTDAGPDGGASQADVVRGLCDALEACDPDNFAAIFDAPQECDDSINASVNLLTASYGEECGQAFLDYLACAGPGGAMCGEPDCAEESEAYSAACEYSTTK